MASLIMAKVDLGGGLVAALDDGGNVVIAEAKAEVDVECVTLTVSQVEILKELLDSAAFFNWKVGKLKGGT